MEPNDLISYVLWYLCIGALFTVSVIAFVRSEYVQKHGSKELRTAREMMDSILEHDAPRLFAFYTIGWLPILVVAASRPKEKSDKE
jgi:hypothetical protein